MMAGQMDIPVGTVATNVGVPMCEGSSGGRVATTGAMGSGVGTRRSMSAARYVTNATPAASTAKVRYDGRTGYDGATREAVDARNRASSRSRKCAEGSMTGRFLTRSRLRRTTVSWREHLGQRRACSRISFSSSAEHIRSTYNACLSRNSLQSIPGPFGVRSGTPATRSGFRDGQYGGPNSPGQAPRLVDKRLDNGREGGSRTVEPRFHRAEVAVRDFRDLFIGLPFELAQHEHLAMVLGQLRHRLLHQLAQVALAVHVVGARRGVLELDWTVLLIAGSLNRLEEHEWASRTVAQLVFREVRRNGVGPRRELLGPIEAVQVSVHPDEDFLHEILGAVAIADRPIYEVEQTRLVTLHEFLERPFLPTQ